MPWRVVLTDLDGRLEAFTVDDVAALREVRERVLADPYVAGWRYWRLSEDQPPQICWRCGRTYRSGDVALVPCRCGVPHVRSHCFCGGGFDPPRGQGCGDLPRA